MKKIIPFLLLFLVLALAAVPALGATLSGGYYMLADCDLGYGLTFYVPADCAVDCLTYDDSGYLFNLSNDPVYLYCADYPFYTFYAPRMSVFMYRNSSVAGVGYESLNLTNVTETNIQIMDTHPPAAVDVSRILVMIASILILGVGAKVILRR